MPADIAHVMPFDPAAPPAEPPDGADVTAWRVAYQLRLDHQPDLDGSCMAPTCHRLWRAWPCPGFTLAGHGLLAAVGFQPSRVLWARTNTTGATRWMS